MEPNWKIIIAMIVLGLMGMLALDRWLPAPQTTFVTTTTTTTTIYVSNIGTFDVEEHLVTTTVVPPFDIDDPSTYPPDDPNPPIDPNDTSTWPTEWLLPDRCPNEQPCD